MGKKTKKKVSDQQKPSAQQSSFVFPKLGIYGLILLLVLIPVVHTYSVSEPASAIRNLLLSALSLPFIGYFLFSRKASKLVLHHRLSKWFVGLWVSGWLWSVLISLGAISIPTAFVALGHDFLVIALLIIGLSILQQNKNAYALIFKSLVLIGLFHAILGVVQYLEIGFEPTDLIYPYGFAFNRTIYGSFLALLFPFAVAMLFAGNKQWRVIGGITVAAELMAIVFSQCRSAWVALGLVVVLANVMIFIHRGRFLSSQLKLWWGMNFGGLLAAVIALVLVVQFNIGGPAVQSTVERLSTLWGGGSTISSGYSSMQERLLTWNASLEMMADQPIKGVGADNWKLAAPPYLKEVPSVAYGDYFLTRPHNSWLQIGVERGVPGLLLHLGAWGLLLVMALRAITRSKDTRVLIFRLAVLGGLVAFATDMIFGFPHERLGHLLYFALLAVLVLNAFDKEEKSTSVAFKLQVWGYALVGVLLLANTINAYSNLRWQQVWFGAFNAIANNQPAEALAFAEKGKGYWQTLGPNTDPIEVLTSLLYQNQKQFGPALAEIEAAAAHHPNNYRVYNAMGTIYTEMERYAEAEKIYLKCLELTPEYRALRKNLALNYFKQQQYQNCLNVIESMDVRGDEQLNYMLNEGRRILSQ